MAKLLSGKSAIITGSGSGIGRAVALIAREGARVIVQPPIGLHRGWASFVTGASISVDGGITAQ